MCDHETLHTSASESSKPAREPPHSRPVACVKKSNAHARCNQRIGQCSRRDLRSSVNAVLLGLLVLTCWTTSLIEDCLVASCDFLRHRSEHTMRCRENTEHLGCSVRHTPKFTENPSERVAGPPRFLGFCSSTGIEAATAATRREVL